MRDNSYLRWQALVFVVIVAVFLYLSGQLTAPFVAGDDWAFLVPANQQGGQALPWANTLAEGRWINYAWYQIGVHLSARTAFAFFVVAWVTVTGFLASFVSDKRLFLLCALALFLSPMFSELSLWPATMFSGMALSSIAMFALARSGDRFYPVILFVATFALVMAYPPFASIVFIAALAGQAKITVKSNIILAVTFLIAFATSALSIYALNAMFHGYFGVKVAPWRHPHPLRSFVDLGTNLQITAANWHALVLRYGLPITCTGVASVLLLLRKEVRARGVSVIFAFVICWCVAIGTSVIAGVVEPGRSVVWLWVAACLMCALVASRRLPLHRYSGVALLLVLMVSGGISSWHNYRTYRPVVAYVSMLGQVVHKYQGTYGHPTLSIAGNLSDIPMAWSLPGEHWPMPGLKWMMWKEYGIQIQRCEYATCTSARKYLLARNISRATLLQLDGKPVLAVNQDAVGEILRNYPSEQQEVVLRLHYPTVLQYGPDVVRITPFYPGTSKAPVSIALPSAERGYSLQSEDSSCAYPVDYKITDSKGTQLAAGQYRGPGVITINKLKQNGDFSLLSLQMASGAKNNYACNIVVAASE